MKVFFQKDWNPKSDKKFPWLRLFIICTIPFLGIPFLVVKSSFKPNSPVSPLSEMPSTETQEITSLKDKEDYKNISYYITTSQEFLTKARVLAEQTSKISEDSPTPRQQTPEEKQKIIDLINYALDVINQGIAAYPTDDRVFAQRANIYQALTPFLPEARKFALQDLREAIKLNKQNPSYHLQLANLYLGMGNFEAAAFAFYNAHLLEPTNLQTLYSLGDALEKSGQLAKAKNYFEKLMGMISPTDENQSVLKKRTEALNEAITKAKLQYLTSPGEETPLAAEEAPIIGTQELPLEQAAIASKLIIASDLNSQTADSNLPTGEISLNAKSGEGIIPAGKKEVIIYNNNVANDTQIIIIPSTDIKNKILSLAAKKAASSECLSQEEKSRQCGWFKVGIDDVVDYDIKFKWWIVKI